MCGARFPKGEPGLFGFARLLFRICARNARRNTNAATGDRLNTIAATDIQFSVAHSVRINLSSLLRIKRVMEAPTSPRPSEITQLLLDWSRGNKAALDGLIPLVYPELRKLARHYLRSERSEHTLQPTALIHEAYLRLVDQDLPDWQSRAHFFGVAARLMRQILVDHARTRRAERRGGGQTNLPLEAVPTVHYLNDTTQLLAFDEALNKLQTLDERKSRIVELRSFAGLSMEETAAVLGISEPTVKREMRFAKAWLRRELKISDQGRAR